MIGEGTQENDLAAFVLKRDDSGDVGPEKLIYGSVCAQRAVLVVLEQASLGSGDKKSRKSTELRGREVAIRR